MKLKNKALQELYETITNNTIAISPIAVSPFDTAFRECDEKLSESVTFEQIKNLQDRNDILEKSNGTLLGANLDLCAEKRCLKNRITKLEKDLDDVKKQLKYFTLSRDDWRSRAKHAEKEVEELKKFNSEITSKNVDIANENVKLARKNELLEETLKETTKIRELKSRLNSLYGVNCYDQGQTDLWIKLQNVNDSQPNEFDVECKGMEDVISMDLEDFLDAYKKWQEQKEKERLDHMRDYLDRFCRGRLCSECPLESDEYKCGNGYSFRKFADDDQKIISDEELERYYEKVKPDDPCSGVREKIKEACDAFYDGFKAGLASEVKEVPVSCDIPIKDLASWECTIEATVEINKDLLEKVCGVKPEEEEHKLEYGDAVRLPWRDYDYMYIGPEGKHIRLFDPKSHDVVVVSVTENMTYQGCKIVLCDEDDLRKIWNHKK